MRDSARTERPVPFSARTAWDTNETEWARALGSRRERGLPIYDLTAANPTHCGLHYEERLLEPLLDPAALRYEPEPRGLLSAREAVIGYYRDHAAALRPSAAMDLSPQQILLTASTSEAYSFLFRLLCGPGDEVLIAQPSYPLFDFLAVLDDVKLVPYPLFYDHGWHLDLHGLRAKIGEKTRAIVVVHPNNPTGHFTANVDRKAIESISTEFGLALIVDEVFLDYSFEQPRASFLAGPHPALTFVLSGLSKVAGLPQMKLSWIAVSGPQAERETALERLEIIADTFLSVSTPLQLALTQWLGSRENMQRQILARVRSNLIALDALLHKAQSIKRLEVEGGWYAILRAPALGDGEQAALSLLLETGVAVHPGSFFGVAGEGHFVLSLLPGPEVFQEGASRFVEFLS